jgi:hypothetical protein
VVGFRVGCVDASNEVVRPVAETMSSVLLDTDERLEFYCTRHPFQFIIIIIVIIHNLIFIQGIE